MLEKWKTSLGKGKYLGAVFMEFSKFFARVNHNLLISKLADYSFFHLNNWILCEVT